MLLILGNRTYNLPKGSAIPFFLYLFIYFNDRGWLVYKNRSSVWSTVPDPHLCVTHALRLGHLVGEVRLLESRGAHSLVHGRVGAWRRVRRIQARLDQGLARLTRDHGLELAGGKSVHVARFTGHQQQDLGSRQGGQLVRLRGENSTVRKDFIHLDRSGSPNWGLD